MTGPERYLLRCNNEPPEGVTITRDAVETALSLARAVQDRTAVKATIVGDLETGLTIHVPAGRPWEVESPGTEARTFTYMPLPAGQHRAPAEPA